MYNKMMWDKVREIEKWMKVKESLTFFVVVSEENNIYEMNVHSKSVFFVQVLRLGSSVHGELK
jgi:hypothetical protein